MRLLLLSCAMMALSAFADDPYVGPRGIPPVSHDYPVKNLCSSAGLVAHAPEAWKLVDSDEFHELGAPNSEKWNLKDAADGSDVFYTARSGEKANAYVKTCKGGSDGRCLMIEARQEDYGSGKKARKFTSALLQAKTQYLFGRFEFRARMPYGRGLWPAIWLLGNDPRFHWTSCGEIDVLENQGFQPCQNHSSVHYCMHNWGNDNALSRREGICGVDGDRHESQCISSCNSCASSKERNSWACGQCDVCYARSGGGDFHTYTLDWLPTGMTLSVDGKAIIEAKPEKPEMEIPTKQPQSSWHVCTNPDTPPVDVTDPYKKSLYVPESIRRWPFDGSPDEKGEFRNPFTLILNMAVGGNFGGQHGINPKAFPARLEVDYVRIYQPTEDAQCQP